MFSFKFKYVFKAINCVAYVSLLYLGCYFITAGKVWERFQHKKTSFAEYTELVKELPSITTWIEFAPKYATLKSLRFGVDFNITLSSNWNYETTLKGGENNISGLSLMLGADYDYFGYHVYRLTPLNFDTETAYKEYTGSFWFTYNFVNQT